MFQWFDNNLFKNNLDKCHLLISSNENISVKIGEYEVENSEEELLGAKSHWKLNCDDHISTRCKRACGELNALAGIARFIGLPKRRILMNACFNSLLIWISHSRTNNRKKNRFHERGSCFIYNDNLHRFQNYSTLSI